MDIKKCYTASTIASPNFVFPLLDLALNEPRNSIFDEKQITVHSEVLYIKTIAFGNIYHISSTYFVLYLIITSILTVCNIYITLEMKDILKIENTTYY